MASAKKIVVPFLRTPYNYDTNTAGDESALECKDPTLTQQHEAEDADINTIMKKFAVTGQLPTNVRMPTYGDFTKVFDFQSAMNAVREAETSFYAMPANVRTRFHNDPQEFVEFCSNTANRAEAEKLGLISDEAIAKAADLAKAPPPKEPPQAAPTPPPASPKGGKE